VGEAKLTSKQYIYSAEITKRIKGALCLKYTQHSYNNTIAKDNVYGDVIIV